MSSGPNKAIEDLYAEAEELIESLDRALKSLAAGDGANECFRLVHTFKGVSAASGLDASASLAHSLESVLDAVRLGRLEGSGAVLDAIYEATEIFARELAARAGAAPFPADAADEVRDRLEAVSASAPPVPRNELAISDFDVPEGLADALTYYEETRLSQAIAASRPLYLACVSFPAAAADRGVADLKKQVDAVGELITVVPDMDSNDWSAIALQLLFAADEGIEAAEEAIHVESALDARVSPVLRRGSEAGAPGATIEEVAALTAPNRSVRVAVNHVDGLVQAIEDLDVTKRRLGAIVAQLGAGDTAKIESLVRETAGLDAQVGRLHKEILELRKVPMRYLLSKLGRVVRRLARDSQKSVSLRTSGEDLVVDRGVVEALNDPLMHVLRNAVDHGIESASEREAAGKARDGSISIEAALRGDEIVVAVSDDGRGIDSEAVMHAAVKQGLVGEGAASDLSERELVDLLMAPGLSTRDRLSEASGRGFGLDIALVGLTRLGGSIHVSSSRGLGTTVVMTVPVDEGPD